MSDHTRTPGVEEMLLTPEQRERLPNMPHRPRLLDLFCCAGGATRGYQLAGFHVVGVDIEPQPDYCGALTPPLGT